MKLRITNYELRKKTGPRFPDPIQLLLLSLLFVLAACSNLPEIDPYITFNIVRSVDFPLSDTAQAGVDASITVMGTIDTLNDYKSQGSAAYLLHTSRITRLYLHSSDPNFTLDNLVYARVLIGEQVVAMDSNLVSATDTLSTTGVDITSYMRDTSFLATLQFKLSKAPANPVTITAGMTIVHTAIEPVSH